MLGLTILLRAKRLYGQILGLYGQILDGWSSPGGYRSLGDNAQHLEVALTYPDCHHRTSSVRWNHPTLTHTVEHIFQVKTASGVWAIESITDEPVGGRIKNRGTSEVTRHQRTRTDQEFRMVVRLKDENGTRFLSTGGVSSPITIGPCPGH